MSTPPIDDFYDATGTVRPGDDLFDDQTRFGFAPAPRPSSTHFYKIDPRLQSLETQQIYIGVPGPDGKRRHWDLWGPGKGRQGLMLMPGLSGLMHMPFQQLMSEGPYQIGSIPERVDWRKRELSFAVGVGVGWGPDTSFRYRMLEERWWSSWSATMDGYWGVYTRTHGWRFLKVRLAEEPKTPLDIDPVANGNNFQSWDVTAVAVDPHWYKRVEVQQWQNASDNGEPPPGTKWQDVEQLIRDILLGLIPGVSHLIPGLHIGEGVISIWNRGTQPAHPSFLVSSPGKAFIQDGPGGRMVECPLLTSSDGVVLINTDPLGRTATATTDPIDPIYMRIARNSQLLDFILHDITSSTLPVWRRMEGYFQVPWPPLSIAHIRVQHTNPNGMITALMPQRYAMGYA